MKHLVIAGLLVLVLGTSVSAQQPGPPLPHPDPIVVRWGAPGDIPVAGDYDGDQLSDVAVYRPSTGEWFFLTSTSNFTKFYRLQWGTDGDVPMPGKYTTPHVMQIAVYRPSSGEWFIYGTLETWTCSPEVPGCVN